MKDFLVSVAVPTYNRQKYAEATVRQIENMGDDIQIVITDNSTDDSLGRRISDICDGNRVKYIYTPLKMAVVENYDKAAKNSDGEFFISIGDDDILLKSVIRLAKWMKNNNVDAVRTSRSSVYSWPSDDRISNGLLALGPFSGEMIKIDPYDATLNTLKKGCQSYMELDMIGTYHEIASMDLMRKAYNICGYYYSGLSPDIYSSTVLSLMPNIKAYKFDYPISIPGFCPNSATFRGKKGVAVSTVEDAIKKYGKPGLAWDSKVPRFYMPQTTWAVSMIQAVKDMGKEDLLERYFDKAYLINACCNYQGGIHKDKLMEYLTNEEKTLIDEEVDTSFTDNDRSVLGTVFRKVSTVYHLIKKDKFRTTNVKNSRIAADLSNEFLESKTIKKNVEFLYCSEELKNEKK